jgi:hypothetical protein
MFGNRFDKNDSYEDLRRREEYERQKDLNFARGVGNFLYIYILYALIWMFTAVTIAMSLSFIFGLNEGITTIIGFFTSFFVFKVPYTKLHPVQSLITIAFIMALIAIIST